MRENRPSGSEGGVALTRHPYPYRSAQFHLTWSDSDHTHRTRLPSLNFSSNKPRPRALSPVKV